MLIYGLRILARRFTGRRDPNGLALTNEELDLELLLQDLDLAADGALRQLELASGQRHAAGPRGGLESGQDGS